LRFDLNVQAFQRIVDGNEQIQTLCPGMFNSGDGNADNIAESIDERSTTIAAGNRNIGLNMPEAGFGILSPRTDNSLGNRRRQAQGWGCRSRTLLRVVGFGLSYRQDAARTDQDFYRYHIPHGIAPQYLSGDFQPVSEDDLDAFPLLNHVLVCKQIPRPTDDEFGTVALP
jgi:hypothetical protein